MLHELLERAFGEACPSLGVDESYTLFAGCECTIAVLEYGQAVQLEIPTRINLHSRTVIAEIAGVSSRGDERYTRGQPELHNKLHWPDGFASFAPRFVSALQEWNCRVLNMTRMKQYVVFSVKRVLETKATCAMNPSFSKAWEYGLRDYGKTLATVKKTCSRTATQYDSGKKSRRGSQSPCALCFAFAEYSQLRWKTLFEGWMAFRRKGLDETGEKRRTGGLGHIPKLS